jgi:hypothetical protein
MVLLVGESVVESSARGSSKMTTKRLRSEDRRGEEQERGTVQVFSNSWSAWTSSMVCQEAVGNGRVGGRRGVTCEGVMRRMVENCAVFVCGRGLEVDWSEQTGGMEEQGRLCVLWNKISWGRDGRRCVFLG